MSLKKRIKQLEQRVFELELDVDDLHAEFAQLQLQQRPLAPFPSGFHNTYIPNVFSEWFNAFNPLSAKK